MEFNDRRLTLSGLPAVERLRRQSEQASNPPVSVLTHPASQESVRGMAEMRVRGSEMRAGDRFLHPDGTTPLLTHDAQPIGPHHVGRHGLSFNTTESEVDGGPNPNRHDGHSLHADTPVTIFRRRGNTHSRRMVK